LASQHPRRPPSAQRAWVRPSPQRTQRSAQVSQLAPWPRRVATNWTTSAA